MSGALKKVLGILGVLLVGMLLIYTVVQILFPNLMDSMVMAVEDSIYNMTSFSFDIDGDGRSGGEEKTDMENTIVDDDKTYQGDHVEGWSDGGATD